MTTSFPTGLDALVNPTGSDKLNAPGVIHHQQHSNLNDAMEAVQAQIGVTGSSVATSMEFRLHNTASGHDHDGINSRPVKLGTSGSSGCTFSSGYYTDFTTFTEAGDAVCRLNHALKLLSGSIMTSSIAFESQTVELTPSAIRVDFTGSGVSGSVSSSAAGDKVTYTIPGIDYKQIVFLRDCGPFENIVTASGEMFHSFSYAPRPHLVSASVWFEDSSKAKKIFETNYQRNSRLQATKVIYIVYESDGISIKNKAVDIITYNGVFEATRTRTIT